MTMEPAALPPSPEAGSLLEHLSKVQPFCVFAAGRTLFQVMVRGDTSAQTAKTILFLELPLAENGWNFGETAIKHIGSHPEGKVYQLSRKAHGALVPDIAKAGFQSGLATSETADNRLHPDPGGSARQ